MNGRKSKQLRREQTEEHVPETNWSMGRNRRARRSLQFRTKERSFTRPGPQVMVWNADHTKFELKQANHVMQDYSHQRYVPVGTNHQKMVARKKYRVDLAAAVERNKVAENAPR